MDLGAVLVNPWLVDLATLFARIFIGVCFVIHALGKLGLVGTGNMQGFTDWLRELDVPYPAIQARLAMLSELGGGLALVVGFWTRPACLLLIFTMVVAGRIGHRGAGYLITNDPPGAEYTVNLAVICLVIFLLGPGVVSLDALLY